MGYETIEHIILQDIEQFKSISQILIQSNTKNDQLRQFLNDNHSIHHKYMHMQIDISDTPPGVS